MIERPGTYGADGAAITAGMVLIHAAEQDMPRLRVGRGLMGRIVNSPNAPATTFELTAQAPAGPDDERPSCEGIDPDLFFPSQQIGLDELRTIRRVCFSCPRQEACLQDGLDESYGVWGGYSANARKRLKAHREKRGAS